MNVLLSIKPKYANAILNGDKEMGLLGHIGPAKGDYWEVAA